MLVGSLLFLSNKRKSCQPMATEKPFGSKGLEVRGDAGHENPVFGVT